MVGQHEKGPKQPPTPAHISETLPAPWPPAKYSEGVEDLVNEVKYALKGEPHPAEPAPAKAKDKPSVEAPKQTHEAEIKSKGPDEAVEPPKGKQWYPGAADLPLGFEPPPGYAVPPPKKVLKSTAGLLLVAPAVAEFTASEPLLSELASTVDNLAKYAEDNPKAEKGVNRILETVKKDLEDLGSKIESNKKHYQDELRQNLETQAETYTMKLIEADMAAQDKLDTQDEEWKKYFDQERLSLLQKYQEKLDNELEAQKDIINER
jgi:MICOS complex subunit MIC60